MSPEAETMRCISAKLSIACAVDGHDQIALLEAGGGGAAAGDHAFDARRQDRPALDIEQRREDHDGEDEIGERPRRDDGRALPDLLREERHRALGFRHLRRASSKSGSLAPLASPWNRT